MSRWVRSRSFSRRKARSSISKASLLRTGTGVPERLFQSRRLLASTPRSLARALAGWSPLRSSATASRLKASSKLRRFVFVSIGLVFLLQPLPPTCPPNRGRLSFFKVAAGEPVRLHPAAYAPCSTAELF